jgi:hypothetical protein
MRLDYVASPQDIQQRRQKLWREYLQKKIWEEKKNGCPRSNGTVPTLLRGRRVPAECHHIVQCQGVDGSITIVLYMSSLTVGRSGRCSKQKYNLCLGLSDLLPRFRWRFQRKNIVDSPPGQCMGMDAGPES